MDHLPNDTCQTDQMIICVTLFFFFYCKTFPEMKQTTQRRLQQSKSCVFSLFFHFKWTATGPELTVSEAPSKTATGHGEWCLFMTHFYLPSGGREEVGVEEREPSSNKGRIVLGYKTVPCGCQENKVLVKPIRDGLFSSWYWLLLAGNGQYMGTFMRQLPREEDGSDAQWRHSNCVEKSNDWKWSGCFHSNLAGPPWVGVHHDYIYPQMVLVPWRSRRQSHTGF